MRGAELVAHLHHGLTTGALLVPDTDLDMRWAMDELTRMSEQEGFDPSTLPQSIRFQPATDALKDDKAATAKLARLQPWLDAAVDVARLRAPLVAFYLRLAYELDFQLRDESTVFLDLSREEQASNFTPDDAIIVLCRVFTSGCKSPPFVEGLSLARQTNLTPRAASELCQLVHKAFALPPPSSPLEQQQQRLGLLDLSGTQPLFVEAALDGLAALPVDGSTSSLQVLTLNDGTLLEQRDVGTRLTKLLRHPAFASMARIDLTNNPNVPEDAVSALLSAALEHPILHTLGLDAACYTPKHAELRARFARLCSVEVSERRSLQDVWFGRSQELVVPPGASLELLDAFATFDWSTTRGLATVKVTGPFNSSQLDLVRRTLNSVVSHCATVTDLQADNVCMRESPKNVAALDTLSSILGIRTLTELQHLTLRLPKGFAPVEDFFLDRCGELIDRCWNLASVTIEPDIRLCNFAIAFRRDPSIAPHIATHFTRRPVDPEARQEAQQRVKITSLGAPSSLRIALSDLYENLLKRSTLINVTDLELDFGDAALGTAAQFANLFPSLTRADPGRCFPNLECIRLRCDGRTAAGVVSRITDIAIAIRTVTMVDCRFSIDALPLETQQAVDRLNETVTLNRDVRLLRDLALAVREASVAGVRVEPIPSDDVLAPEQITVVFRDFWKPNSAAHITCLHLDHHFVGTLGWLAFAEAFHRYPNPILRTLEMRNCDIDFAVPEVAAALKRVLFGKCHVLQHVDLRDNAMPSDLALELAAALHPLHQDVGNAASLLSLSVGSFQDRSTAAFVVLQGAVALNAARRTFEAVRAALQSAAANTVGSIAVLDLRAAVLDGEQVNDRVFIGTWHALSLSNVRHVGCVDLRQSDLRPPCFAALAQLIILSDVMWLDGCIGLTSDLITELNSEVDKLPSPPQLTSLHFNGCLGLGGVDGSADMCRFITTCQRLNAVSVHGTRWSPRDQETIEALANLKQFPSYTQAAERLLQPDDTLRHVELTEPLTDRAFGILLPGLRTSPFAASLSVKGGFVSVELFRAFCRDVIAVPTCSLTHLVIEEAGLTGAHLQCLVEALCTNASLVSVDLRGNNFSSIPLTPQDVSALTAAAARALADLFPVDPATPSRQLYWSPQSAKPMQYQLRFANLSTPDIILQSPVAVAAMLDFFNTKISSFRVFGGDQQPHPTDGGEQAAPGSEPHIQHAISAAANRNRFGPRVKAVLLSLDSDMPNVSLVKWDYANVDDDAITVLCKTLFERVVTLSSAVEQLDDMREAPALPQVRALILDGNDKLTDASIVRLAQTFTDLSLRQRDAGPGSLRKLSLRDCGEFGPAAAEALIGLLKETPCLEVDATGTTFTSLARDVAYYAACNMVAPSVRDSLVYLDRWVANNTLIHDGELEGGVVAVLSPSPPGTIQRRPRCVDDACLAIIGERLVYSDVGLACNLTAVCLPNNTITSAGLNRFLQALSLGQHRLSLLDLSNNQLDDSCVAPLCEFLVRHRSTLSVVDLRDNNFTSCVEAAVVALVQGLPRISSFVLEGSRVSPDTAERVSLVCALQSKDDFSRALSTKMLEGEADLQTLETRDWPNGGVSPAALVALLRLGILTHSFRRLRRFSCAAASLDDGGRAGLVAGCLIGVVTQAAKLQHLDVSGNTLSVATLLPLLTVASRHAGLRSLRIPTTLRALTSPTTAQAAAAPGVWESVCDDLVKRGVELEMVPPTTLPADVE